MRVYTHRLDLLDEFIVLLSFHKESIILLKRHLPVCPLPRVFSRRYGPTYCSSLTDIIAVYLCIQNTQKLISLIHNNTPASRIKSSGSNSGDAESFLHLELSGDFAASRCSGSMIISLLMNINLGHLGGASILRMFTTTRPHGSVNTTT